MSDLRCPDCGKPMASAAGPSGICGFCSMREYRKECAAIQAACDHSSVGTAAYDNEDVVEYCRDCGVVLNQY